MAGRFIREAETEAEKGNKGQAFGKAVKAWQVLQPHETDETCAATLKKIEPLLRKYGEASPADPARPIDPSKRQFIE